MRSPRRLTHVLMVLLVLAFSASAEKVSTMPAPTGYIDDYANVLSDSAKAEMEATARELHNKTRAQVFLVTINTLEGEPAENFANELFAKWKIGEKKTDRGVLMLFAIKDHKRWIEIGYGLEGILNDAKVGDIGRAMVPALRAARYDDAAKLGLTQVSQIIAADSGVTLDTLVSPNQPQEQLEDRPPPPAVEAPPSSSLHRAAPWFIFLPFLIPVFIFVFMLAVFIKASRRRAAGGVWSGGGNSWSNDNTFSSSDSSFSSSSDDSFSGGDGGSSGGGGAAETGSSNLGVKRKPAHRSGLSFNQQPATDN